MAINTKPTNKIEAIKVIRCLPVAITTETINKGFGDFTASVAKVDIGLKEAKDLVEAIMELKVPNYTIEDLKTEAASATKEAEAWKEAYYQLKNLVYRHIDNPDHKKKEDYEF